jgi:recombination protein RecT
MAEKQEWLSKNLAAIEDMLKSQRDRMVVTMGSHIKAEKFMVVALDLIRTDSLLSRCEPLSIMECAIEASELDLLPGPTLGHCFFVPFRNGQLSDKLKRDVYEATMMVGYRGFINLAMRTGRVNSIFPAIVYKNEVDQGLFDLQLGTERRLLHKPILDDAARGDWVGAYGVIEFKDGGRDFSYLTRKEVEKRRDVAKTKRSDSPWKIWPEEMIRKTPIRHLLKRCELTIEITGTALRDETREYGPYGAQEPPALIEPQRRSLAGVSIQAEADLSTAKTDTQKTETENSNGSAITHNTSSPLITDDQVSMLTGQLKKYGWTEEETRTKLLVPYKIDALSHLQQRDVNAVLDTIRKTPNAATESTPLFKG